MDAIPIAIFWVLAIWGVFFARPQVLFYLFFGSASFGSFAVVPPTVTGGLTFIPSAMLTMLIVVRYLGNTRGVLQAIELAVRPRKLMFLSLFWLVAAFTTFFMPRLFQGMVDVIPVRATVASYGDPLEPTTQNLSQLIYLTISVLAVFAFSIILKTESARQNALSGIWFGGAVAVITGIIDFSSQFLPITPLLEPFRTATYALLTDVEIQGGKRVVGLMPEASSFGGLCLGSLVALYFFRRAMPPSPVRDRLTPALLLMLLLMIWLSKSSAGYVGLTIFAMTVAADWVWRGISLRRSHPLRRTLQTEFWLAVAGISALCLVVLFQPSLLDPIVSLVNEMIFQKGSSASFEERSMWTHVSWVALLDTYGLGVGVGSTRASNAFVALASNTGFLGAALFYAFLIQLLTQRAMRGDESGAAIISSFRWAFWPPFIVGLLIATGTDFGGSGALRFALVLAVSANVSSSASGRSKKPVRNEIVSTL